MLLRVGILALSTISLINCAPRITLHPLTGKDIYAGTVKGDWCFSAYYLDQVMQTKIEKTQ